MLVSDLKGLMHLSPINYQKIMMALQRIKTMSFYLYANHKTTLSLDYMHYFILA